MLKAIFKNKSLFNLLIYGVGQGFNLITPLLVVPYLIYICDVNNYGKTGIGMALSFFLIVIIDYGSDIAGVKDISVNRDNKQQLSKILSTAYTSRFVLLIVVSMVMLLLYNFVPYFNNDVNLYILGLPILLGQCLSPTWVFQGLENFKGITIVTIASKILFLCGVFIFINVPQDYVYVNLLWGVGMIVPNTFAFIYLISKYNVSLKNTSKNEVLNFLAVNFSMFSSQLFISIQLYAPIILIGFLGGSSMAGKYKVIDQVIVVFKTYIFLFFNYVYPRVCYLIEKNVREAIRFWKTYNMVNFVFIALCMAILYFMANPVVTYFTGKAPLQTQGTHTELVSLLKFAIFIPLSLAVSIPLKQLILGYNKQQFYTKFIMVMVIVNIALLVVLFPLFKIYAVIASIVICEVITIITYTLVIKIKHNSN